MDSQREGVDLMALTLVLDVSDCKYCPAQQLSDTGVHYCGLMADDIVVSEQVNKRELHPDCPLRSNDVRLTLKKD